MALSPKQDLKREMIHLAVKYHRGDDPPATPERIRQTANTWYYWIWRKDN